MTITNNGLNLIRDLLLGSAVDGLIIGGIGVSGALSIATQTGLVGSETVLNDCDSISGWGSFGDALQPKINGSSGQYKEGGSCIDLGATFSLGSAGYQKTMTVFDYTNKDLFYWFYIQDRTFLAVNNGSIAVRTYLGSNGIANALKWDIARSVLIDGWNIMECDTGSITGSVGTVTAAMITGSLNTFAVEFYDNQSVGSGQARIDFIRFVGSGQLGITDSKNNLSFITFDKAIRTIYTLNTTESNGYRLREYGNSNGSTLGSLFDRQEFAVIDKDEDIEVQVDSFIYFSTV